jgi:CRP/FNR family transcriptional regulator
MSLHPMGLHEILLRTPALAGISPALLDELVSAAEVRTLERGAYLWHAGDKAESLTVIRAGLIKVVKTGAGGKRSICGLFGAPDTVGDAALWRRIPYPADAIVVTSTGSFVDIPMRALEPVLERAPQLNRSCAEAVQNKLSALLEKIDVLSAGAVEARLGTLLLNLYDRFGDEQEDGTRFIPVVLSRQELADLVSTSFETAIRVMTRWEREGVVETNPHGFVLRDVAQLERASGREPTLGDPSPAPRR